MRELFGNKAHKKGKRIIAGVFAIILTIMATVPNNYFLMDVNAEQSVKNSIAIVGGTISKLEYKKWIQIEQENGEKIYQEKWEDTVGKITNMEFGKDRVSKVIANYKPSEGYFLESVRKDGTALDNSQYNIDGDNIITYDAGDKNNIGNITLRCIPKELSVSNLKVARINDNQGVPTSSVNLTWDKPTITETSGYSLDEYRLIVKRQANGKEDVIFDDKYPQNADNTPVCNIEDAGIMGDASSTTATYTVAIVADKAYQKGYDSSKIEGSKVTWKAVYDMMLSVTGQGLVEITKSGDSAATAYNSANTPCTIYNIPSVKDGTNFNIKILPEEGCGVSSFLVNGSEEKGNIEAEEYNLNVNKNGNMAISFAPFAATPVITSSGATYTEIAGNGEVEITSAENVESTYYAYKGLETAQKQTKWTQFDNNFKGGKQTVKVPAEQLFGNENYALLRAYSTQTGYADSKIAEQYYYRKPEMPAITAVSFSDNYELGQWTANSVTVNYVNSSARKYDGLQLGYIVNGQGEMQWQDMSQQGNVYSYTFGMTGEYTIAFRFKLADPNQKDAFVYGDPLLLDNTIKVDEETPSLIIDGNGYVSGVWSFHDVTLNLNNSTSQLSGTDYEYAVSDQKVADFSQLEWNKCESENQVKITCDEGKVLTQYVYMKAVSNAGKESEIVPYVVMIDKETPALPEVSFSKVDGENGWYKTLPVITMKPSVQDTGSEISVCYKLYQEGQDPSTIVETIFDGTNQPTISADGMYVLQYFAKDTAGNISEIGEEHLKVDTGAPNGPSIEFKTENDSVLAHIINFITFGYFCNERVVAVVQSSDSMSDIKEYGVWYTKNGKDSDISIIEDKAAQIELPENFEGTVSAYAVDNAGNQSVTTVSDGIIYENIQSEITITTDVDNSKWQNKDVGFHVVTQDTDSGLRNVEYILNGKTIYQNDFTGSEYNDITYMNQMDIKAEDEAVSSNGYTLQVKVTDNAGNKAEKSEVVYLDKTAPVIELSGIENGVYSNNTENLTVRVIEQIYDLNQVTVTATRTIDGVTTDYGLEAFKADKVDDKKNYAFSEDGMYVVTVSAVDAAGNVAVSKQISFTIDKTAPKIELTGPQNDSYHASDVPVIVNVEESFYDNDTVTINVTKTLDGQTSSVDFGSWSNQGKSSSLTKSFSEDGTYQIEVQAKDAAGNQATSQQLTFTVDKTAPEVSINGASDYYITGNTITLSYDVVESYFDSNSVSIQVQKEDAEGNVANVEVGNWVNSGKESSLSYELKEDGIYTSVITAVDKAGNHATAKKTVTVDTSDPIIKHVDEMNGKYYQVFKLPYELSEMVADLTVPNIRMSLNSDEYDGASEVTDEGKYVFKMDVSDEVGHQAIAQAEFIVDNTEPKVIFNGIEDGMKSESNIDWSVTLADANDKLTEVVVDGEKKEIGKSGNIYQDTLRQKGKHTVEVKAEDLAGNVTTKTINVTISEKSVISTWSNNKPLVIGGIVVVAGAAGVGVGCATGVIGKGAGKGIFKKVIKK